MATTTTTVPGTAREPRITLGVALHRPRPGRASIADVAAALNVLTAVIGEQDDAPPLDIPNAHVRSIRALAVVEDDGTPLIISADAVGGLLSWRLDGTPGELEVSDAHTNRMRALAVVEDDGAPLIISAGGDGALRSWRLDGTPGPLQVPDAHVASMVALTVVGDRSAPLIISGGGSGVTALRSWRLDGTPGALQVRDAHLASIGALAVVEDDDAPLIISAGRGADGSGGRGTLRSWLLDGGPGGLHVRDAHAGPITALAVVEHRGAPLIISGGEDGALRSWRLNGTRGPLQVRDAHAGSLSALAVVEHRGAPLIISGGVDGALRSWRLNGTRGPLQVRDAHVGSLSALAVVEHRGAPLIISGGADGALRSWRLGGSLAALEDSTAQELEVRQLSLGSLVIAVQLPADVLTAVGVTAAGFTVMKLTTILDVIKRVAGFPAELRLQHTHRDTEQLLAEVARIDAEDRLDNTREQQLKRQLEAASWEFDQVVVTDDEDDITL